MANREKIAIGEYYHIYNRGVDKRLIVKSEEDAGRFLDSLKFFNSKEPIRSLREITSIQGNEQNKILSPLVEIICYALNPNHYHLLLKEVNEGGVSEFMKRLNGGYTWYFNNKYKRSGALFQGVFKSVRIISNEQLLHVNAYINLNHKAHQISGETAVKPRSSWEEYVGKVSQPICKKEIILEQFRSVKEYKEFTEHSLRQVLKAKKDKQGLEMIIGKYFY